MVVGDRGSGHYDLIYKVEDLPEMQVQIMRASGASYEETNDPSKLEQELLGASYNTTSRHHVEGTQLQDSSFYLTPVSTLNRCSISRPSDLPVAGGLTTPEYIPCIAEEHDDRLFEDSIPLPFDSQPHESRRGCLQLPKRFRQEDQIDQKGPFREAVMKGCSEEDCDEDCKNSCGKTKVSRTKGGMKKFVPSPDPKRSKATKKINQEYVQLTHNLLHAKLTDAV